MKEGSDEIEQLRQGFRRVAEQMLRDVPGYPNFMKRQSTSEEIYDLYTDGACLPTNGREALFRLIEDNIDTLRSDEEYRKLQKELLTQSMPCYYMYTISLDHVRLIEKFVNYGVEQIIYTYEGSGDCFSYGSSDIDVSGSFVTPYDKEKIDDLFYNIMERTIDADFNNEGSSGTLVLDLRAGTLSSEYSYNREEGGSNQSWAIIIFIFSGKVEDENGGTE